MKTLLPKVLKAYSAADKKRIRLADEFAAKAHAGQVRKSGQPYIMHPRAVAEYLANIGMDADTVIAGLLHDVVEDTDITSDEIAEHFGATVQELVEGVTKLGQIHYTEVADANERRRASSAENVRKLLLAMSRDMRVLMIKLADRFHNLQTLEHLKPEQQQRIAQESLEVYAPLADRLGMGVLKAELEDLAFRYANPTAYELVSRLTASHVAEAQAYIEELREDVLELLKEHGVSVGSVSGRSKHLFSTYRKLTKTEGDITKIYDLTALRVIVPTVTDCYQVLGLLHQRYKPLIYRIKDYISVPKPNGYRSLHTTVFAKYGRIIEFQIRTPEMHQEAEYGLAAHSLYNVHKTSGAYREGQPAERKGSKQVTWIQELASLSAEHDGTADLMQNLKIDLFKDRIFIFSPKGDLYDLPEGATPVDFAFAIHTVVGLRAQGARVNGSIAPLDRPLHNRDVVEIITRKTAAPNRQWLHFVKTAGARTKIKSWFRAASRDANISTGRQLIEEQLGTWGLKKFEDIGKANIRKACDQLNLKDTDALLAAVGEGTISLSTALRRLLPPKVDTQLTKSVVKNTTHSVTGRVYVLGAPELPCTLAICCQPQIPDELVGYITRGKGVTVHQKGCINLPHDEPDRLFECGWETAGREQDVLMAELHLSCRNRIGLVHDITGLITGRQINIVKITTYNQGPNEAEAILHITVEVADLYRLNTLMQALRERPEVVSVERTLT